MGSSSSSGAVVTGNKRTADQAGLNLELTSRTKFPKMMSDLIARVVPMGQYILPVVNTAVTLATHERTKQALGLGAFVTYKALEGTYHATQFTASAASRFVESKQAVKAPKDTYNTMNVDERELPQTEILDHLLNKAEINKEDFKALMDLLKTDSVPESLEEDGKAALRKLRSDYNFYEKNHREVPCPDKSGESILNLYNMTSRFARHQYELDMNSLISRTGKQNHLINEDGMLIALVDRISLDVYFACFCSTELKAVNQNLSQKS